MKKFIKSLLAVAVVLGSVVFGGNTAFAATPGYISSSITGVTQTSAIFNGTFNPSSLSTTAWFEMQNQGGQLGSQNIGSGSANVPMNPFTKTGLTPSTTYSFRAVAQNQTGTTYGPWVSFTTQANNPPAQVSVNFSPSTYTVQSGSSATIFWTSQNATSCTAVAGPQNWLSPLSKPLNGSFNTGAMFNNMTYQISCTNGSTSDTSTALVTVQQIQGSAPVVTVNVAPTAITAGNTATLSWSATNNPTSCSASWTNNAIATSGSIQVSPSVSTNYIVTCSNSFGSGNNSAFLTVNQQANPPVITLTASPTSVPFNGSTTLSWSVANATSCTANSTPATSWAGTKNPVSGSQAVSNLTTTTFFNLFCTGATGLTDSKTVTVTVGSQVNLPVVDLTAVQTNLPYNGSTTLAWTSAGADTCVATNGTNGWSGSKNLSGTFPTGNLTNTTTYTLTCTNTSGSTSDSVTITVDNQQTPAPTVNLYASQSSVNYNESSTINWTVSNATSCNATNGTNGWSGPKSVSGGTFYTGALITTTTYTITCTNSQGQTATDSVTIYVQNQNTTPTVTTNAATNVSYNNATLNGYVNANGGSNVNTWFEWGINGSYGNQTTQTSYGSTSGTNFSYSLGGLSPSTTYSYRAVAQNTNGQIVYGNQVTFTTPSNYNGCTYNCGGTTQSVTTYFATNTLDTSATLNGYVETNGTYTTRWFEWGTSTNYLYNTTTRTGQSASGNFSQYISGLTPNTTYYFRAVAQGNSGLIYGNVSTFTTNGSYYNNNTCNVNLSCTPTAVTTLATNLGPSSARLNGLGLINGTTGTVSTNGYFEWGPTQALGNVTTTGFIGNATSNPFYASLFSLQANTTYYFRAVVSNSYGVSRGDIVSFRTGGVIINTNPTVIYRNTTVVSNTDVLRGTSRPSLVFLTVTQNSDIIRLGETVEYFVNYKNVSAENLTNVVLRVSIPKELEFLSTTNGYYSPESSTVVVNVGNLFPQQEGGLRITTRVLNTAQIGKLIVVTGNLPYTLVKDNSQEEVFAYSKSTVADGNINLSGAALFGAGFWPTSIFGWLLLLLLLLLLILAARMAYRRVTPVTPIVTKRETTTTTTEHHTM